HPPSGSPVAVTSSTVTPATSAHRCTACGPHPAHAEDGVTRVGPAGAAAPCRRGSQRSLYPNATRSTYSPRWCTPGARYRGCRPMSSPTLAAAYERCRRIHAEHGRSYYLVTLMLPRWKRPHVHALCGFTRYADELI